MNFYRLDERNDCGGSYSVHFLNVNKPKLKKLSIDHRMNAVIARPLRNDADTATSDVKYHVVVAGDSNGDLHLFVISENLDQPRMLSGLILNTGSRPILCIDMITLHEKNHFFVFVGNTAGEISIWELPDAIFCHDGNNEIVQDNFASSAESYLREELLPSAPLYSYKAHQMGTNSISAINMSPPLESTPQSEATKQFIICSGGDDQALTTCNLKVNLSLDKGNSFMTKGTSSVNLMDTTVIECASFSAFKSVKFVTDKHDGYRLYAVGYDQNLSLWQLVLNNNFESIGNKAKGEQTMKLIHLSSCPVDVSDVSSFDCITIRGWDMEEREVSMVSGEGVEIFSIDPNIPKAASILKEANYLLITAGAGFSADSGLATYESFPKEYLEMCNPYLLAEKESQFQRFWLNFTKEYASKKPHDGYRILEEWCQGEKLKGLLRPRCTPNREESLSTKMSDGNIDLHHTSPWWVYTSNVDGHFCSFSSFDNCICEVHGNASEFRCPNGIGFSDKGEMRMGEVWAKWNERVNATRSEMCNNYSVLHKECGSLLEIDKEHDDDGHSGACLACPYCNLPLRPNVLMFNDTDKNVLGSIANERDRYQKWEERVENDVFSKGRNLVILELGCGTNVPAVRQESEEVLMDCIRKAKRSKAGGSVHLIRVNPKDSGCCKEDATISELSPYIVSIRGTALKTMRSINEWLDILK